MGQTPKQIIEETEHLATYRGPSSAVQIDVLQRGKLLYEYSRCIIADVMTCRKKRCQSRISCITYSVYIFINYMSSFSKHFHSLSLSTLLYALEKSRNAIINPCNFYSISICPNSTNDNIWSLHPLCLRKPPCSSAIKPSFLPPLIVCCSSSV